MKNIITYLILSFFFVLQEQAEALMLADYPLLPAYFYVTRRLVQPGIAAPAINPMNRTYSRYFRIAG